MPVECVERAARFWARSGAAKHLHAPAASARMGRHRQGPPTWPWGNFVSHQSCPASVARVETSQVGHRARLSRLVGRTPCRGVAGLLALPPQQRLPPCAGGRRPLPRDRGSPRAAGSGEGRAERWGPGRRHTAARRPVGRRSQRRPCLWGGPKRPRKSSNSEAFTVSESQYCTCVAGHSRNRATRPRVAHIGDTSGTDASS